MVCISIILFNPSNLVKIPQGRLCGLENIPNLTPGNFIPDYIFKNGNHFTL